MVRLFLLFVFTGALYLIWQIVEEEFFTSDESASTKFGLGAQILIVSEFATVSKFEQNMFERAIKLLETYMKNGGDPESAARFLIGEHEYPSDYAYKFVHILYSHKNRNIRYQDK